MKIDLQNMWLPKLRNLGFGALASACLAAGDAGEKGAPQWTVERKKSAQVIRLGNEVVYTVAKPAHLHGLTWPTNRSRDKVAFVYGAWKEAPRILSEGFEVRGVELRGILWISKGSKGAWEVVMPNCEGIMVSELALISEGSNMAVMARIMNPGPTMEGREAYRWVVLAWDDAKKPCRVLPATRENIKLLFPEE